MDEPRVSLWRMTRSIVLVILGTTAVLSLGLVLAGESPWVVPAMLVAVPAPFALLSGAMAWRARSAMLAFAREVGGEPAVDYGGFGHVTLSWPDRPIELTADAYRGTVWRLSVEVDGTPQRVQRRRIEAVAFETLGRLGELEHGGEPWDGDVDGPLHLGSVGGVAVAGVAFAGLGLIALPERFALVLGGVATVVAAVLAVWGGLAVRRRLRERLRALEREGRAVGQPRLVHAGIRPRWALWVGTEFVRVRGLVLGPWSSLDLEGVGDGEPREAGDLAEADPRDRVDERAGPTRGWANEG